MIIDARVDEMLEMIDDAVKKSGIRLGNWSNVYFTGGGLMPHGRRAVLRGGQAGSQCPQAAVKTVKLKPAQIYASGSDLLEPVLQHHRAGGTGRRAFRPHQARL